MDSVSWLPGTIPGCTSTQTAVVRGSTSLIPRPCLSGGNGPNTVVNTGNRGPHPVVPRPQSSVAGFGSSPNGPAGGDGENGENGAGVGSGPIITAPLTESPLSSTPSESAQPAAKPSSLAAGPTSIAATVTSSNGAWNPVAAGGGGGHNPLPRPESTAQGFNPITPNAPTPTLVTPYDPTSNAATPTLIEPTADNSPSAQATATDGHGHHPTNEVPTVQPTVHDTATALTLPKGAGGPTELPFAPTEHPFAPSAEPVQLSTSPPAVISIGTSGVTADSSSHFVIGSQTLAPGSAPITHSGTVFSLPPSGTGVVIGPSTQSVLIATLQPAPIITLGSSTLVADSASQFHVGSQTLIPGGPAIINSVGRTISLAADGSSAIVNGQTQQVTQQMAKPTPVITVGGSQITANSQSQFVIGPQTLVPGGSAVINTAGQTLSLAVDGSSIVIDGQTQQVSQQVGTPAPVLTIGGSKITANSQSHFVIGSQTLAAGSSAITVSGQVISLVSSGNAVVFGERTQAIHAPSQFIATQAPILTIGHATITANSRSEYVVAGQTLQAGSSAITISGSKISLAPSASAVVINGQTAALTPHSILATVAPPAITVGGSTIKPTNSDEYVVAGQTLKPGSAITVSGTPISLASGALDVVIGSSTAHLKPQILALTTEAPVITMGAAQVTPVGPGEYIYGGQTFEPGDMMTISGTIVSLAADDSFLEIGDSTSLLPKSDYALGTQTLEPGHAITVSGTVISLASDDSFVKVGSSTETLHGQIVTQSTLAKETGLTTSGRHSVPDGFITGSLAQAAATGSSSPSASASGKKNAGHRAYDGSPGAVWLNLICLLFVTFGFSLI